MIPQKTKPKKRPASYYETQGRPQLPRHLRDSATNWVSTENVNNPLLPQGAALTAVQRANSSRQSLSIHSLDRSRDNIGSASALSNVASTSQRYDHIQRQDNPPTPLNETSEFNQQHQLSVVPEIDSEIVYTGLDQTDDAFDTGSNLAVHCETKSWPTDLAGQANVASNNNSAYIHGQHIKKSTSSTLGQAEGIGPGSGTSELSNIDVNSKSWIDSSTQTDYSLLNSGSWLFSDMSEYSLFTFVITDGWLRSVMQLHANHFFMVQTMYTNHVFINNTKERPIMH